MSIENPLESKLPARTSGLMRVAGVSPEEEKEILNDIGTDIFNNQKLDKAEREKTPEELAQINGILASMPAFIKKYGGISAPIKPEHIHIIDPAKLTPEEKKILDRARGLYRSNNQAAYIFADNSGNGLGSAHIATHELIHFNAFQAVNFDFGRRREGWIVTKKEGEKKTPYFWDINEAITEELTRRFEQTYFGSIPTLAEELERARERRDKIAITQSMFGMKDTSRDCGYTYPNERKKLWEIIEKIHRNNSRQFKSKEDIFNIFAEAYFTGKILGVSRLIEKTYGKGSFKKLGEETRWKLKVKLEQKSD